MPYDVSRTSLFDFITFKFVPNEHWCKQWHIRNMNTPMPKWQQGCVPGLWLNAFCPSNKQAICTYYNSDRIFGGAWEGPQWNANWIIMFMLLMNDGVVILTWVVSSCLMRNLLRMQPVKVRRQSLIWMAEDSSVLVELNLCEMYIRKHPQENCSPNEF